MIDLFSLALTHGLLVIAAWRLIQREDIDPESIRAKRMRKRRSGINNGVGPDAGATGDA